MGNHSLDNNNLRPSIYLGYVISIFQGRKKPIKKWYTSRTLITLYLTAIGAGVICILMYMLPSERILTNFSNAYIVNIILNILALTVMIVAVGRRQIRIVNATYVLLLLFLFGVLGPARIYSLTGVSDSDCSIGYHQNFHHVERNYSDCIDGKYSDALYFSLITWTTLGYGDLSPVKESRMIAAFQALHGTLVIGTFIGLLVSGAFYQRSKKPGA